MAKQIDLKSVYDELVKIMKKQTKNLKVSTDNKSNYSLTGPMSEKFNKELWFGGVQIKKNYVSYHLMPVYMYSDLIKEIPDELKKRMQGKSCFNFNKIDKDLFIQLAELTDKSIKTFKQRGDDINYIC